MRQQRRRIVCLNYMLGLDNPLCSCEGCKEKEDKKNNIVFYAKSSSEEKK